MPASWSSFQSDSQELQLQVRTRPSKSYFRLELRRGNGRFLGASEFDLGSLSRTELIALFYPSHFLNIHKSPSHALVELGALLGRLLGKLCEILNKETQRRSLVFFFENRDTISSALAGLPWSQACLGALTIAEANIVPRVLPAGGQMASRKLVTFDRPAKMLAVMTPVERSAMIDLPGEQELLKKVFREHIGRRYQVELELCTCHSKAELFDTLKRPFDILHFAGHANRDRIYLDQGFVMAPELAEAVCRGNAPYLVVLNACKSGVTLSGELVYSFLTNTSQARDLFGLDATTASLASSLLDSGVSQVVGMRQVVTDSYSLSFCEDFYRRLLSDTTLKATDDAAEIASAHADKHGAFVPILFGASQLTFRPLRGRSRQQWPSGRVDELRPKD